MKKVTILFSETEEKIPFSTMPKYKEHYERLYLIGKKHGIEFSRASVSWVRDNKITKAWFLKNGKWQMIRKTFTPDIFWDKASRSPEIKAALENLSTQATVLNTPLLSQLMWNKNITYMIFKDMFPKSYIILDQASLIKNLKHFSNSKNIVLKPIAGSGGRDVKIAPQSVIRKLRITESMLLQEYKDTSGGIPGVMKGKHDLRIHILNNKIFYAYYRAPKKGSLLANVAQGGSMVMIPNNKIPASAVKLVNNIIAQLQNFGKNFYSIDLMFDKNKKPWIVEFNAKPGIFFPEEYKQDQEKIFERLMREYFV